MRRTIGLMLVGGWCCVQAGAAPAQAPERLRQRSPNPLTQARFEAKATETRPQTAGSAPSNPGGSFETRGVVYLEEFTGPASAPRLVAAPRAPLTLPTATSPDIRPNEPTPVMVRPPAAVSDDSLRQRFTHLVAKACPQVRDVRISFPSSGEVAIEMSAPTAAQANAFAERIFAIHDLDRYRVHLKFNVPQS